MGAPLIAGETESVKRERGVAAALTREDDDFSRVTGVAL
jgi:hypothetical protein